MEESCVQTAAEQIHECKVCHKSFENLQDVLKHELLNHAANASTAKPRQSTLKRRVNAVWKALNGEEERKSRQELAEIIENCEAGEELNVIINKYKLDNEDLLFIYTRVHTCLIGDLNRVGNFSVEAYGSFANGLALKTSDIDLHITCKLSDADPKIVYKLITKMLYRSKCFSAVCPIRQARVPIIKCVHSVTGFSLDINTCEPFGVYNSKFIHELNQCDTRIHHLMLFLKIWSNSMHIHGAFNMTNYCLLTLVIFFLQNSEPPVLESIKILQRNAPTNRIINGINFGVNTRGLPSDSSQSVHELIKGFFKFYHEFDFENLIIAPYLGKTIKRVDFQNNTFKYVEYENQLRLLPDDQQLRIDRPMCIQDMFFLNINVGNGLSESNVQYFKQCITMAHRKCSETKLSQKSLYKSLLVEIIDEIIKTLAHDEVKPANNGASLSFDVIPRVSEIKSLAKFENNSEEVQKMWTKEYMNAILQIITDVYRIDMTQMSPTQNNKCKKIDEDELGANLPPSEWSISCDVDLWSGRDMQRSNVSFMDYQLAQTKQLYAERRQQSKFEAKFKGFLTISIVKNYAALHVEASSTEVMSKKKDPFRKFFNMLKCSVQNYNLKQKIHQLEQRTNV